MSATRQPGSARAVEYFEALSADYGAQRYGAGGGLWHRYFFGGRRQIALDLLRGVTGIVADVGAGPGPLSAALRAQGCRVVAVDRAHGMLREARGTGAAPVGGDALALPLADESCDAAVALGLASYVADLDALVAELARVVKPGGTVVLSVATSTSPDWWMRRVFRGPARQLGVTGALTAGVPLHTRAARDWRVACERAGLSLESELGHDFTLFPVSRFLPAPSVALGRAVEALRSPSLSRFASEVVLRMRKGERARHAPTPKRRPRLARVIARLNVGGPAIHALLTTRGLEGSYDTTLATGRVDVDEVEATHLIERYEVDAQRVPGLGRAPVLADDARALLSLMALFRRTRPDLVHTHTAKAGALGRIAAWLTGVPRAVHTFHGHVFHGYFGRLGSGCAIAAERFLARRTDAVLAVSPEVARDLTQRYHIASEHRVRVVPIGLPLDRLAPSSERRTAARGALGLDAAAPVLCFAGRMVPVKEPDVALRAFARVREVHPDAVLLMAGGGPLLDDLRARGDAGVRWLGWRDDVDELLAASDVALLSSRNEGTPVALIEAGAAGLPAVSTDVGGVKSVVIDRQTGLLAPRGDDGALADAVLRLLADAELRARYGEAARSRVLARWSGTRLLRDLDGLYRELLSAPG